MSTLRWISVVTIAALAIAGCRGETRKRHAESTGVAGVFPESLSVSDTSTAWDSTAGPILAIAVDYAGDTVSVVGGSGPIEQAHTPKLPPLSLELFGGQGLVGMTTLGAYVGRPDRVGCQGDIWPAMRVSKVVPGWQVGFEAGYATGIRLDSLEAMLGADSATFVATVTRLASNSIATRDTVFSSVPFVVRRGYRFQADHIEAVIALLERNIPLESYQRSDFTLIIAERPIGSTEPFTLGYVKRTKGGESETVATSLLAAVTLRKTHQQVLVVRYEHEEGQTVGFIERVRPKVWRGTWESEYEGC